MSDLYQKFKTYIEEKGLLDCNPDHSVLIGVSGGADSVCLLLLFKRLSLETGIKISAVHINHGLRGADADADELFVKSLCNERSVPLEIFKEDVKAYAKESGVGEEEAGRQIRYKRFFEVASKSDAKVAVAHHMDDNAETIIHNLIRGASITGISGMKPETEVFGCHIIRPLLFAQKNDIEKYLQAEGQTYRTDATNKDIDYTRNRIRCNIIKEMNLINPQTTKNICRFGEILQDVDEVIKQTTDEKYRDAVCKTPDGIKIHINEINGLSPAIRNGVVYKAVAELSKNKKDISFVHVSDVLKLSKMRNGQRVNIAHGITAVKKNEDIFLSQNVTNKEKGIPQIYIEKDFSKDEKKRVDAGGYEVTFELIDVDDENRAILMEKNQYTKAFDYDKIFGSLVLGSRQSEDEIILRHGSKPVGRLMIDAKIPRDDREDVLILKDEKSVMWVLGLRISEAHKITSDTKKALRVTAHEK